MKWVSDKDEALAEGPAVASSTELAVSTLLRPADSQPQAPDTLQRIAVALRRHGLTTPALMVLTIARPLGFVGGQCLSLVQPLIPQQEWQTRIGQTASALEDEATWTRLENLLQ